VADLEAAEDRIKKQVQGTVRKADQKVADAQRALNDVRNEMAKAQAEAEAARARAMTLQERITELTPGRVFVDFADERSTDYRRRLGLLSTVRQDLDELENQVKKNNQQSLDPTALPTPLCPTESCSTLTTWTGARPTRSSRSWKPSTCCSRSSCSWSWSPSTRAGSARH
jgi:hypothetical protein